VKIGLMGGTFDPIHLGHLRAAESARESLGLARVVFVPAGTPPHRTDPVSSARDRFTMVALATAGHPGFVASDIELTREGPSYTVDTVRGFLDSDPEADIIVIVGSDAFAEMGSWKEPEQLFSMCSVAVVTRPGELGEPAPPRTKAGAATAVQGPTLAVSATLIRRRIRQGRSVRYLVPEGVAEYIAKRELYQ